MLISTVFDEIRSVLRDPEANEYTNTVLTAFYNRAQEEIYALLMQIGAEDAYKRASLTGTGVAYAFSLPSDFLAFVPGQILPRSPGDATADYRHGMEIKQVDRQGSLLTQAPTIVGTPRRCFLSRTESAGTYTHAVAFDAILPSGHLIDYLYWPTLTRATVANIASIHLPWGGLLAPLFKRTIEQYAREGLEFTVEARAAWRAMAEDNAIQLLGMRHLQTQETFPSLWKGVSL